MTRCNIWTQDEEAYLATAIANNITHRTIAEHLGRTINSVKRSAYRLGLYSNKPSKRCGKEESETDMIECSEQFVAALDREFSRFANDNGIGYVEAMNRCLCAGEAR